MKKNFFVMFALLLCGLAGNSQEAESTAFKQIKAGSVFLKPGFGGFFKVGRLDDELPTALEDHAKKLRSGFVWGIDGGVMISENDYIGATFSRSNRSGSFRNSLFFPGGSVIFTIDNTETIQYVGAYYGNRQAINPQNKVFLHSRAGLGFWNYRSQFFSQESGNFELKESNIGFQLGAGLEARVTSGVSWVLDADLLTGNVKIEDEKENLSQIRVSTGLLFRF
jgi:opacity protein-like surface antigen